MSAPWWESTLVGFDLETTGPDPETARIVTACVVTVEPDGRTAPVTWLVDPGIDIPAEATAVHGVTTERARTEGWEAAEAIPQIIEVLAGTPLPLVAFNAAYDFTVLDREAHRHGVRPFAPFPVIDPYVLDRQADRYRPGKRSLGATCEHYGIRLDNAHTAEADAAAAVLIAREIGRRDPHPPNGLEALHNGQIVWRRQQQQSLADYFRAQGNPAADDVDGAWPVRPVREGARA